MTTSLLLASDALRCEIAPALGGAIAGLWLGATPVLRSSAAAALTSVRNAGSYPLVPFSNRVGHGSLRWAGTDHPLVVPEGFEPHAIHGVGWLRPWSVLEANGQFALLSYEHQADESWPFAFDASQAFRIKGNELDGRADLYSLGVILYELLTGKLPFDAKQPLEFIQLHVNAKPIPLGERVPGMTFPPGLEAVVMKTMEKRPEDRYTTAQEFADALDQVANPNTSTPPPQPGVQAWSSGVGTAIHGAEPPRLPPNYVPWVVLGVGITLALVGLGAMAFVALQ